MSEDTEAQIKSEQEKVEGFLEVAEKRKQNKQRVMKVIAENKDIHEIESKVAQLCKPLNIDLRDDAATDDGNAKNKNRMSRERGDSSNTD
jgi:hypothetical protein